MLDSIGCALAAKGQFKGEAGVDFGLSVGGTDPAATILGADWRASVLGAAFANVELINTLDMDCVVPPGHVVPYVLPGALALGESRSANGKALIEALAIGHEMSLRIGRAMDNLRDTKDGQTNLPKVFGYMPARSSAARLRLEC